MKSKTDDEILLNYIMINKFLLKGIYLQEKKKIMQKNIISKSLNFQYYLLGIRFRELINEIIKACKIPKLFEWLNKKLSK